jgi:hypothetical protein
MSHRFDAFEDYGRYEDMAFPYPDPIDDIYPDMEEDFPIDFGAAAIDGKKIREAASRAAMRARGLYVPDEENYDFWDSDYYFHEVCCERDFILMDKLREEFDHRQELEELQQFRFETSPLRHWRKRRWKLKFFKQ